MTAAAVSATSLSTALTTGTATVTPVNLAALITPANSTAQIFASSDYYGVDWVGQYGQPQVIPFFLGPQGIVAAIDRNANDPAGIAVLASGWGAGQTASALRIMQANDDPALNNIDIVVLDNNSNRAGGGFWTTYWMFAPLLLTSAEPTPDNLDVPVVDVAYDYNINSAAPTYPLTGFALANSLVAYVYGYGGQATAPVPQSLLNNPPGPGDQHYHYILNEDGTPAQPPIPVDGNITYVTFKSDRLPLVKPLLLIPGGEIVADAVEPTLTLLVNWGYKDGQPIPDDPGVTRPVGLLPPLSQTVSMAQQLPGAVQDGVQAAQQDLSSPSSLGTTSLQRNTVTNPATTVAANSPSSLLPSLNKPITLSPFSIDTADGSKVSSGSNSIGTSSPGRPKPVQQFVGRVSEAIGGLADSLTNGGQKNETTGTTPGSAASAGASP